MSRLYSAVSRRLVTTALLLSCSPLSVTVAQASPKAQVAPTNAVAPHPKHCLDERQWMGAEAHHPLNLFEGKERLWVPCGYALRDAGYSVKFPLAQPVQMDGFKIRQSLVSAVPNPKSRRKELIELPRKRMEKLQVLFFNSKLSTRYPIYFHEVLFEGQAEVSVRYEEPLDWNPILLRDAQFDERRRALKLPATELMAPIEIDAVGVVFWERSPGEAPTALEELELTIGGVKIPVDFKVLRSARTTVAKRIEAGYAKAIVGRLLIGEERSLVFAKTGTLWGMEGEEETPKVMGRWRVDGGALQVALGKPKTLKRLEKRKRLPWVALHSIIDEVPERLIIKTDRLAGDYQVASHKPHAPPKSLLEAPEGAGVTRGTPVKVSAKPKGERPPTFEPEGW